MNLKTHVGIVQSAPHCPFCWGPSRVAFLRADAEGRLHRRRVCVNGACRKAFWTVEAVVEEAGDQRPDSASEADLPVLNGEFAAEMRQAIDRIGTKP